MKTIRYVIKVSSLKEVVSNFVYFSMSLGPPDGNHCYAMSYYVLQDMNIEIYNPRNTQAVELYFRGEKMAKVMGSLAAVKPSDDHKLSGVLVKRGFNYHLIDPSDLSSRLHLHLSDLT